MVAVTVLCAACGARVDPVDAGTTVADAGGGSDAGAPDAGVPDAGGPTKYPDGGSLFRYWDGGTCTVKTDCPCFSSDDCGPGFTCHSEDTSGTNVFCVPGTRGAGLVGAPCAGEADCLSALCIDSATTGQNCSALCDSVADCVSALPRCLYIPFGPAQSICSP